MVPTNQSIIEGRASGTIPTGIEELKQFLRYYFIEGTVFSDGKIAGIFKTTRFADDTHNNYSTVEIINAMNELSVKDHQGNIRQVISGNIMSSNGVIHQVESLLFY
jgi:hypothetical protein